MVLIRGAVSPASILAIVARPNPERSDRSSCVKNRASRMARRRLASARLTSGTELSMRE
jgi:hypothetical protein